MSWDGGLFQKTAKTYLIPWNGSLVLKFILGQPRETVSSETHTFPACPGFMSRAQGAFDEAWNHFCCGSLKETPTVLSTLFSKL